MKKALYAITLTLCVSGCAIIDSPIPTSASREPGFAYFSGRFSRHDVDKFALILRNIDTGREYAMPLGDTQFLSPQKLDKVIALKVPLGNYIATHWITYVGIGNERTSKNEIKSGRLAKPIHVSDGQVVFLGDFDMKQWTTSDPENIMRYYKHWSMTPKRITTMEAQSAFDSAYPQLRPTAFSCLICE
jgi:hypothetical protein